MEVYTIWIDNTDGDSAKVNVCGAIATVAEGQELTAREIVTGLAVQVGGAWKLDHHDRKRHYRVYHKIKEA